MGKKRGGNFGRGNFVGGWGRGGLLKRFAPFSYLNLSFTLTLNVKFCIRCIYCISSDFTLFFYLSRVMLDERFVH